MCAGPGERGTVPIIRAMGAPVTTMLEPDASAGNYFLIFYADIFEEGLSLSLFFSERMCCSKIAAFLEVSGNMLQ